MTYQELNELVYWDGNNLPQWKDLAGSGKKKKMAGSFIKGGIRIRCEGKTFAGHRLKYLTDQGILPDVVWPFDGNLSNCAASNLIGLYRLPDKPAGIYWNQQKGQYAATHREALELFFIGYYDSQAAAVEARAQFLENLELEKSIFSTK